MSLFIKQTEQRSQLQSKIAADLRNRMMTAGSNEGGNQPAMPNESQNATGRSLFWVGVITMVVIALVIFVLFVFEGI